MVELHHTFFAVMAYGHINIKSSNINHALPKLPHSTKLNVANMKENVKYNTEVITAQMMKTATRIGDSFTKVPQ